MFNKKSTLLIQVLSLNLCIAGLHAAEKGQNQQAKPQETKSRLVGIATPTGMRYIRMTNVEEDKADTSCCTIS